MERRKGHEWRRGRGHECEGEEGVTSGEEEEVNVRERKGS